MAQSSAVEALFEIQDETLEPMDPRVQAIETLINTCLRDAGTNHSSDGITYVRVSGDSTQAKVRGNMWCIDQTEHVFWLDLERAGDRTLWQFHFDPDVSGRRARNLVHMIEDSAQVAWRIECSGQL